jgi:hypothetical protein
MAFDPDAYLAKEEKKKGFDPDAYLAKTKPETALQTFGRSAASIPDTALNLITGALDYGAYNLARAAGLSPEEAQRQTTSPKDVIGRALGVAGTPGYENAPQRQLGNYLGQTLSEGIVNPLTETTGLPEQDVASMVNSLTMAVPGMAKGGYQAVKPALKATKDVVGGAIGRGTGYIAKPGEAPVGYQVPSSRAPLRDTVMLPEDVVKFERGEMPYGQMPTEVPIQQLPRNFTERTALKLSGGEIPYQGQAARAFGERLGETYRNPVTAAIDIGSMFATGGIPLVTTARGLLAGTQGIADSILARRGLDPNLPTRLADYQSGARPMPGTPPAPAPRAPAPGPVNPATMNYPLTVQGPGQQLPPSVMTAPDLSRRVNIEGQSAVLPSQINTTNSQTARPQQTPHQMAIQKTQEIVSQQAPVQQAPVQQAPVQQAPVQQAPVQQAPVATTPVVRTAPAPVEDILGKTRQITKEESKANAKQVRANKKAKAEGKTLTKEPIHPEVERITKEAEPLTQDYIKSLDLDNKTLVEKDAIKQSLITEESKLKSAISNNRITKALNNDEVEALMKRFHAVSKARDAIQNEMVRINSLKERVKKLTEMVEYNKNRPKGRVAKELGSGRTAEADLPIYQKQLDDILAKQPKTLEEKVDVVKSQGEARRNQARGKPDVSEMKIGKEELPTGIKSLSKETTGEIYPTKDAYDKAMIFKTLQEDVPRASYIEGGKLITVFPQNIPKDIIRSAGISPMGTIIRDAKTGKVIKD